MELPGDGAQRHPGGDEGPDLVPARRAAACSRGPRPRRPRRGIGRRSARRRGSGGMLRERPLQDGAEVLQEMKAVRHRRRGRGPGANRRGERLIAIPRNDGDARVRLEPRGDRRRSVIDQHIHDPVPFLVHQDGGVGRALSLRPFIQPQHAHRRGDRVRGRPEGPVHRVGTDREPLLGRDPGDIGRAGGPAPLGQHRPHGLRALLMGAYPRRGESFTEDLLGAGGGVTPELAALQPPLDRHRPPREVLELPPIPTVDAPPPLPTLGAVAGRRGGARVNHNRGRLPDHHRDGHRHILRYNGDRHELTSLRQECSCLWHSPPESCFHQTCARANPRR